MGVIKAFFFLLLTISGLRMEIFGLDEFVKAMEIDERSNRLIIIN